MSTPNIQLMEQLGILRKLRRVAKIVHDDQHSEKMPSVVFLVLSDLKLPVHHFFQLLWVVGVEKALLLFGVYFQLFFDVFFDRVPDMVKVDAWAPYVDSLETPSIYIQN